MIPYARWSPTAFDHAGAFLPDRQEWFVVPVIRTRDSGVLEISNFECAWSRIEDASVRDDTLSCESHRFGHWGPGWFEVILVRPGSHCATEAQQIADALADYPALDEDDYSSREWEAAQDYWSDLSVRERVRVIREHGRGVSIFAARRDSIPQTDCGRIYDYCRPEG